MHIGSSNDAETVKAQYATADKLSARISFHERYSINPQGFGSWLISNYEIENGASVLDIGCGNGSLWAKNGNSTASFGKLVLADTSEGMLETARENLGERDNLEYICADIQALPFEDDTFDAVIANYVLYHVPELARGIAEVHRVLKPDGVLYCATYGEHNFTDTLADWLALGGEEYRPNHNFTMENGAAKLKRSFAHVEARFYEDSLRVTDVGGLVEYLRSLVSLRVTDDIPDGRLFELLNSHAVNGVIELPKEYGMFIARG